MKKLIICSILLTGCAAQPQPPKTSLEQKQEIIINCSKQYVDCLEATKDIQDFEIFKVAVEKCVTEANNCPKEKNK